MIETLTGNVRYSHRNFAANDTGKSHFIKQKLVFSIILEKTAYRSEQLTDRMCIEKARL